MYLVVQSKILYVQIMRTNNVCQIFFSFDERYYFDKLESSSGFGQK